MQTITLTGRRGQEIQLPLIFLEYADLDKAITEYIETQTHATGIVDMCLGSRCWSMYDER